MCHLHNDVILPLLPESIRVLFSCAKEGLIVQFAIETSMGIPHLSRKSVIHF